MAASISDYVKFLHEAGHLKTLPRSGWFMTGVSNPESDADHMYRAAILGYVLAEMEGDADAHKVALMLLFHDMHETRLGDAHTTRRHYVYQDPAELEVAKDQVKRMPPKMGEQYLLLFEEFEECKTKESIIAKDADKLECALQAIEYRGCANDTIEDWVETVRPLLKTESAKKILAEAVSGKHLAWWRGFEERKRGNTK
jgi:putative hydrolase of HD superfamily